MMFEGLVQTSYEGKDIVSFGLDVEYPGTTPDSFPM